MYSRLQKAAVWSGASAVVFAVPVLIFSLICRSGTVRRVGGNYISIPFFLMISAAMILTGICILAAVRKLGRGELFSRLVFAVFSVGMAVGGICLLNVKVGAPLRDISYLGQPGRSAWKRYRSCTAAWETALLFRSGGKIPGEGKKYFPSDSRNMIRDRLWWKRMRHSRRGKRRIRG